MAIVHWIAPISALVLASCTSQTRAYAAKPKSAVSHRAAHPAPIGEVNVERVKLKWEAAIGGYGRAVAISRKLARVAFANRESVTLLDLTTGKRIAEKKPCGQIVHTGLAFIEKDLWVVCEDGLARYSAQRLKPVAKRPPVHESRVTAAAFAGTRVVLGHYDGVVRVYDLSTGSRVEIPVPGPPIDVKSLALTRDGGRVAVAWIQGSIWWWNTAQPSKPYRLTRNTSESDALCFDAAGDTLAEEGKRGQTTLWRLGSSPRQVARVENGDWVKQILFTQDEKWIIRGGSDGLSAAEIGGPRRVALDTRGKVEDVALSEDGGLIAAGDREGRLTVWAPR